MANKIYGGVIYEEPSGLFDEAAWLAFRQQMLDESSKHPDWQEPIDAMKMADTHLAWINEAKRTGRADLLHAA